MSDMPLMENLSTATLADNDNAILSSNYFPIIASELLQNQINLIQDWLQKWNKKVEQKSVHVTFTLRKEEYSPVYLNGYIITTRNTVKYLGLHLDRRLT